MKLQKIKREYLQIFANYNYKRVCNQYRIMIENRKIEEGIFGSFNYEGELEIRIGTGG